MNPFHPLQTPPWSPNSSRSFCSRPRRPSKLSKEITPESLAKEMRKKKTCNRPVASNKMPTGSVYAGPSGINSYQNSQDSLVMTVDEILELIFAEIRAAAIESELYDPDRVFTATQAAIVNDHKTDMHMSDTINDSPSGHEHNTNSTITFSHAPGNEDLPPISPLVKKAAKAPRLGRAYFRARIQAFFASLVASLKRRSASKKKGKRSTSTESEDNTSAKFVTQYDASTRVGQSHLNYSRLTAFEPFHANSPRQPLLAATPPRTPRAESIVLGFGNKIDTDSPNSLAEKHRRESFHLGGPSKIRTSVAINLALRGYFDKDDTLSACQLRYAEFAKKFGWMALSICVHTGTFNRLVEGDETSWKAVCERIEENVTSIELYAAYSQLDWYSALEDKIYPEVVDKSPYLDINTRHTISLANEVHIPVYNGKKQVDSKESFFNESEWSCKPRTDRIVPRDGECALCGSDELCDCVAPNDFRELVELREYPDRGLGVRALRSIGVGEFFGVYLGEMRRPPLRDTTYVVEQGAPGEDDSSKVCLLDARERGNWTRYMNHSCRPAAVFVAAAIGKERHVAVRAMRYIRMFEEITVDYGDQYFGGLGRMCKCGEECCRFRGGEGKWKEEGE